jgi:glutamate--cysteine ligase
VEISLADWANQILDAVSDIAALIDQAESSDSYSSAVAAAREMVAEPDATPSARVLDALRTENCSFFEFALNASVGHRDYFRSITVLSDSRREELLREAHESIVRQRDVEAADEISIDEYLARYFAAD